MCPRIKRNIRRVRKCVPGNNSTCASTTAVYQTDVRLRILLKRCVCTYTGDTCPASMVYEYVVHEEY